MMANHCDFDMLIVGDKKENVEEFVKYLNADFDYNEDGVSKTTKADHHFFRIFETTEGDEEEREDGTYTIQIGGCCAWSISSCMMDGGYTYYEQWMERLKENPELATTFKGITLAKACEKLNLTVEIFSADAGCGFMEHIICDKGEVTLNNCHTDYREIKNEDGEYEQQGGIEWEYTI